MKQVLSIVGLAMSVGSAVADHDITHQALFTDSSSITQDSDGQLTITVSEGSELSCVALTAEGTAFPDYTDFNVAGNNVTGIADAPTRGDYSSEATLAYKCGIRDATTLQLLQFSEPPLLFDSLQTTNYVRLDFQGSCTSQSIVFENAAIQNSGTYDGYRTFTADVKTDIVYGCKQATSFAVPDVAADVMLEPIAAATFVQGDFSEVLDGFTTSDGQRYSAQKVLSYDLGVELPDAAYYVASASCQSGLCKGSLELSLGTSKESLVTDLQTEGIMAHAVIPSFVACTSTVLNEEKVYSNLEACYSNASLVKEDVTTSVSGHVLVPLDCPFQEAAFSDSSDVSVEACLQAGRDGSFDNTCQANLDRLAGNSTLLGVEYTENLFDGKSFTYIFDDQETGTAQRFRTFSSDPATALERVAEVIIEAEVLKFDTEIKLSAADATFDEIINGAQNFRVKSDSWSKRVQLTGTSFVVTDVPRFVKNVVLVGDVLTGCDSEEVVLSNSVNVQPTILASVPTGELTQTDPCSSIFLFTRDEIDQEEFNVTISNVRGVISSAENVIKVCGRSTANCETDFTNTLVAGSSTDQYVIIEDACHYSRSLEDGVVETVYVKEGGVGGFVEFTDQTAGYAPIRCAGSCYKRDFRLPDLSLDWDIEFKVNLDQYELKAPQTRADWNDFTKTNGESHFTMHKLSYLAPPSAQACLADGSLGGDVPDSGDTTSDPKGCLVLKDSSFKDDSFGKDTVHYSGIASAADMRNWIAACGEYMADGMGAKAQVVQQFQVEYDADYTRTPALLPATESFCSSLDISLFVEQKIIGDSSAQLTVAQVTEALAEPDITAAIGNFEYEECAGGYRVAASVDLYHEIDANLFAREDSMWASTDAIFSEKVFSADTKLLTWKTQCADVCGVNASLLETWTRESGYALGAVVSANDLTLNHNKGAETEVLMQLSMSGSPCDKEIQAGGSATLSLYTAPAGDCNVTDDMAALGQTPSSDASICGRFQFSDMGGYELTITGTLVTKKTDGTYAQILCEDADSESICNGDDRGRLFPIGDKYTGDDHTKASTGKFQLISDDAFSTIKYTVFWEQEFQGGSRRLRSEHTFGAGQEESTAQLVILPPSAQISDAAAGEVAEDEAATSEEDNLTQEERDGHVVADTVGIYIGVGLIAIFALVFVGCHTIGKDGKMWSSDRSVKVSNAVMPNVQYMKVRQDRFTASVF